MWECEGLLGGCCCPEGSVSGLWAVCPEGSFSSKQLLSRHPPSPFTTSPASSVCSSPQCCVLGQGSHGRTSMMLAGWKRAPCFSGERCHSSGVPALLTLTNLRTWLLLAVWSMEVCGNTMQLRGTCCILCVCHIFWCFL